MFVDLDWPLNASSLLSASAELLVWGSVTTITRNFVHRSSPNWIVGKGSDHLQLIKFWPSRALGKGVCGGALFLVIAIYHSQRAVFASLWALVSWIMCCWAHGLPTIQCLFCRICKIFCYNYCNDLLRKIVLFRYLGLSAKSYLPDRGLLHFEAILASFYRLGLSVGVNGLSQFWMKIAKWKTPHALN